MERSWWRAAAATWGSAAWLVLQQFGVPAAGRVGRDHRIVRVQEAGRALDALERLPDGRILTIPVADVADRSRQDSPVDPSIRFSAN
jgi:hypothetical protein